MRKFSYFLQIFQILVQRRAVKQDAQAKVQPQHGQSHGIDGAIDVFQGGEIFHIQSEQVGHGQPAQAAEQRPGNGIPDPVPAIGQESEHQGKYRCLENQQQAEPEGENSGQKSEQGTAAGGQQLQQGGAEDVHRQSQNQQSQKQKGVQHADEAGVEPAPVFRDTVDGVQAREQAVHALAGRPYRRQGGDAHQTRGGFFVGQHHDFLHGAHERAGDHRGEQLNQAGYLQAGVAQQAQNQHQGGEEG